MNSGNFDTTVVILLIWCDVIYFLKKGKEKIGSKVFTFKFYEGCYAYVIHKSFILQNTRLGTTIQLKTYSYIDIYKHTIYTGSRTSYVISITCTWLVV